MGCRKSRDRIFPGLIPLWMKPPWQACWSRLGIMKLIKHKIHFYKFHTNLHKSLEKALNVMLCYGTKVRKMRFILEMHFFLDPAAYRSFHNNSCAYTPTHIPTSHQPNVGFRLRNQAESQHQVGWPQASFCSPASLPQALKSFLGGFECLLTRRIY